MAAKTKALKERNVAMIEVDGNQIFLRELRVKELKWIFQQLDGAKVEDVKDIILQFVDKAAKGLTLELLEEMYPSDIEEIWNKFRELNAPFFKAAKASGLMAVIDTVMNQIQMSWIQTALSSNSTDSEE